MTRIPLLLLTRYHNYGFEALLEQLIFTPIFPKLCIIKLISIGFIEPFLWIIVNILKKKM